MHSHHSHSGDYVAHAKDTLEAVVERASELQFDTFCLTEHMPRLHEKYLYPEEIEQNFTVDTLIEKFEMYVKHATEIQQRTRSIGAHTKFLVGMEVEGLDLEHIEYVLKIRERYPLDLVVGSVHYVNGIPIDFDRQLLLKAKKSCGNGTFHDLFRDYFELQYLVLTRTKPEVVGHFDLIRLFLTDDDIDEKTGLKVNDLNLEQYWPDIWELVVRNLRFVKSYGGLIELNSAALRKGWSSPYPKKDIADAVVEYCDGRFCLSDDSHGVAQVGLNYHKVLKYVDEDLRLEKIWFLDIDYEDGIKIIRPKAVALDDVKKSLFFKNK